MKPFLDNLTMEVPLETQINVVESSWNKLAFNLIGDLFLLEPLNHEDWVYLTPWCPNLHLLMWVES